ncbi:acyl-CoA-binding protein [Phlyctochytrium arcticum]|nr:acyl-CoA-binding protein [Phlyctochytrium arcticum]
MEERFLRVVALISATPKEIVAVSNNKKVELYAYYKQAIVGKCNIPVRPGWFDIAGRYKWDAWSRLGDMPKELAMQHYMEEALPILQQCADITFEQVESYMKRYVQPDDRYAILV